MTQYESRGLGSNGTDGASQPDMTTGETTTSEPPAVLDARYELIDVLGTGGMAAVFRAHDAVTNEFVAVKVLHQDLTDNHEAVARFVREGQLVQAIPPHPNIVRILAVGEDQGRRYLVMELVDGGTLKELIERDAPFIPGRAAAIAAQIAEGLQFAHDHGLIHRDIKPQNVLLASDGTPKLADFGIAFTSESTQVTQAGTVFGTTHYLSPEQATGGTSTPASDVYALGIILFEMLTGRVPFDGDTPLGIAMMHVRTPAPAPSSVNRTVPAWLDAVVGKALAKEPGDRYATAESMRAGLLTAAHNRPRRRPDGQVVALAIGAAAVLGLGIATATIWDRAGTASAHIHQTHRYQQTTPNKSATSRRSTAGGVKMPTNILNFVWVSDVNPSPGQPITIRYTIANPLGHSLSVKLRADFINSSSQQLLADPGSATTISAPSGTNSFSRVFHVSLRANGTYDLVAATAHGSTVVGRVRLDRLITVGQQTALVRVRKNPKPAPGPHPGPTGRGHKPHPPHRGQNDQQGENGGDA